MPNAQDPALQSSRGGPAQSARDAGDDQVGALHLRAAVCALRSHAGGWRIAGVAATGLDRRCHGLGAVRCNGFQSLADAAIDAANPRTATRALPVGQLTPAFVTTFVVVSSGIFILAACATESPDAVAFAGGAGGASALFLHQAIHALVASGARIRARDRAGGGVDRGARLARSAHPAAHRGGDVLGGRLRRYLRLPGFRLRPPEPGCIPFRDISALGIALGSRACFMS